MQTLTDRYHSQKHLYDSDHGERVGAGATHICTATELLGLDDPVVKQVAMCSTASASNLDVLQRTGPDDWEAVCTAETMGLKYRGDAVKTYTAMDEILHKWDIDLADTESEYPRPTHRVGPCINVHILADLTIKIVEGGGFLVQYEQIPLRSLGWVKDAHARPQSWEMSPDVAEMPNHAGSTMAELDSLEQRILHRFPKPQHDLVWRYDYVDAEGNQKRSNLPPPTMESRFIKIDALKRQREAQPHRIILTDSPPRDPAHAAAQAAAMDDLDAAAVRTKSYMLDDRDLDNNTAAGQLFSEGGTLPLRGRPSGRGVDVDLANSLIETKFQQFLTAQRLNQSSLEEDFVTPKKVKFHLGPIVDDDIGQGGMGIDAYQQHVRLARGSQPLFGNSLPVAQPYIVSVACISK